MRSRLSLEGIGLVFPVRSFYPIPTVPQSTPVGPSWAEGLSHNLHRRAASSGPVPCRIPGAVSAFAYFVGHANPRQSGSCDLAFKGDRNSRSRRPPIDGAVASRVILIMRYSAFRSIQLVLASGDRDSDVTGPWHSHVDTAPTGAKLSFKVMPARDKVSHCLRGCDGIIGSSGWRNRVGL